MPQASPAVRRDCGEPSPKSPAHGRWAQQGAVAAEGTGGSQSPPSQGLGKAVAAPAPATHPQELGSGGTAGAPCGAGAARGSWWRCSRALSHEAATLLQAVPGSGPALLRHAQNLCPGLGPAVPQPRGRSPPCPSRCLGDAPRLKPPAAARLILQLPAAERFLHVFSLHLPQNRVPPALLRFAQRSLTSPHCLHHGTDTERGARAERGLRSAPGLQPQSEAPDKLRAGSHCWKGPTDRGSPRCTVLAPVFFCYQPLIEPNLV